MTTWFSNIDTAAEERLLSVWSDAPTENPELLGMLLDVAKEQVIAFAPNPEDEEVDPLDGGTFDPEVIPVRYAYAQVQQAVVLWNAGRSDQNGDVGAEGYRFVPRPLDKTIRSIIRPTSGVPRV